MTSRVTLHESVSTLERISVEEAKSLQLALAARVITHWSGADPAVVAGVDVSVQGGMAQAAVVTLDFSTLGLLEFATARAKPIFPYVPGYLAFREIPVIMKAFDKLRHKPDILVVDGHGLAHPRFCGLACHLGITLDTPSIGCAKSRLVGECLEPGAAKGSASDIVFQERVVGRVVRTREGVKPSRVINNLPEPGRLPAEHARGRNRFRARRAKASWRSDW
ncbi:MAG: endonuclease V [Nitrospinae bacterium]|nr:endonuclease V [Nitrospinota bacterium]